MVVNDNEMTFLHLRVVCWETLLLCFCAVFVKLSAGTECIPEECSIKRISVPEYVTALYEHYPALSGCVSRERTSTDQEVHLVLIRGSSFSGSSRMTSGVGDNVDVMIRHTSHYSAHVKATFVLVSTRPIVWRIHSERPSNESLGLFMVSKNSTISHDRRAKLKTKKQDLPTESQKLMTWARKKWQAVTSLMEIELASIVTLTVGDDQSASARCEISSHLPNVYASHIEVQDTRGCEAKWNEGRDGTDVHVIELLSPSVESVEGSRVDVTIDIRSRSRPITSRHVILVLKSHVSVHWHVATHNLRGTLDIITDQVVESNGTNTQSFRVAVEPLTGCAGGELISWTCDKYGPLASYTEAQIANQFHLVVDGRGNVSRYQPGPSTEMTPGSEDDSRGVEHHVGHQNPDYHGAQTEATSRRLAIIRSLLIQCSEDHVTLFIRKPALVYHHLRPYRVSLRDVSCEATENGTHYVLHTDTRSCGVTNRTSQDSVAFMNAILIEWRSQPGGADTSSSSNSSIKSSDPVSMVIDIRCDYPIATSPKEVVSSESQDIQFRLRLFRDATYRDEISAFPAVVEERQNLFLQANITADICIQVNVQTCSLEAKDQTSAKSRPLIVNGCIVDGSVQWVGNDGEVNRQSQQFQLHLLRFWDRNYTMNFKCELTVCTVCRSVVPSVPLCKSRDNQCNDRSAAVRDQRLVASVFSGSLTLVPQSVTTLNIDHSSSGIKENELSLKDQQVEPLQEHNCEQIVQVEGLGMEIVISIAFAAFIIGILLMASLWYIYVRTGPGGFKNKSGMQSVSNSGDSTPSSTVPIAIHQVATSHR